MSLTSTPAAIVKDWLHKDEWKRHAKTFAVVVSRHTGKALEEPSGCFDSEGPNRWCIYAYIYQSHPHFARFEDDRMWQDASDLGFHGGCTFLKYHKNEKGITTSVQVGCDYHHLGDWEFTQYATQEDAYQVFRDADRLFDRLQDMAMQATGATP